MSQPTSSFQRRFSNLAWMASLTLLSNQRSSLLGQHWKFQKTEHSLDLSNWCDTVLISCKQDIQSGSCFSITVSFHLWHHHSSHVSDGRLIQASTYVIFIDQTHRAPIRIIIYNTEYDLYAFMQSDGARCMLGLCVYPEQMAAWAAAKWEISYKTYMPTWNTTYAQAWLTSNRLTQTIKHTKLI